MRYGYFDDKNREYVVTRPDTPRPWTNYSGSRQYGSIITNNAGGYSFYRSAAVGRFIRMRFNSIPVDQPGRYFYLRDKDSGDYWSSSWQPVGKPLDQYESTCRFGTSYTVITSRYKGIESESTYFVPLEQSFEYWRLKLTNTGRKARKLSVFTFCEFASEWNIFQDQFNIQYSAYCSTSRFENGMLSIASLNNLPADSANFANGDQGRWWWMGMAGARLSGYDMDRDAFIGPYRSFHNPLVVERGRCGKSASYGDNACGTMQCEVTLKPGESKELLVLLGVGRAGDKGTKAMKEYGTLERAAKELEKVKQWWHGRLGTMTVQTPDPEFNSMINVWNAYNALITFYWSRSASLVYTGDSRDGYGYRDTVQDLLGATAAITDEVRDRLELMITGQESTGGAMPEVKPWLHKPGSMKPTPATSYRSDDALWLFNAVPAYVAETGDVAFYDKVLPYSDKGEATVLGHLRRAVEFNMERTGAHGLPCGLVADWNDCLKLGFHGESVFVTFQVRYGLATYLGIAESLGRHGECAWAREQLKVLDERIQASTWDGKWFVRAYREDGSVLGSHECDEGKIFMNTQSWAVISGAASPAQAKSAMDSTARHLATPHGIMICTPPYVKVDYHVVRAVLLNPGQKENGGIFSHPQGWAVIAETMLGNGKRAYDYYRAYMPAAYNKHAEVRQIEPYVHCQSTDSRHSPRAGLSHVPWLSGTASWSYYTATQYILGVRPRIDGVEIDPCVPPSWKKFRVTRQFRGKSLDISFENPSGVQKGVSRIELNGQMINGNVLPLERLCETNKVRVVMG